MPGRDHEDISLLTVRLPENRMATTASPAGKKANADTSKYDIDNVIPVLLAVLENPSINFKKMAAMDDVGRTEFAWQHRFRKWRAAAKDIAVAHPGALTEAGGTPARISSKKATGSGRKAAPKQASATPGADNDDDSESDEHKVRQYHRLRYKTDLNQSSKKRAASGSPGEGTPSKRAKPAATKKGTAKPKKVAAEKVVKAEDKEDVGSEVELEFEQAV